MKILAFDIGIRNLAWCLLERQAAAGTVGTAGQERQRILGWQNYDLLAGAGHEAPKTKQTCSKCSHAAKFYVAAAAGSAAATCQRHCPASHPPLRDVSGAVLTSLPPMAAMKTLAQAAGLSPPKQAKKEDLRCLLATRFSLPIEKIKLKKAVEHELAILHDSIRAFVTANLSLFRQADLILLENQPVLKNPTMKSVQILLFATLRDLLQPAPPPLKLVHAGKKVVGKATGDAGYKSRKDASEEAVEGQLSGETVVDAAQWLTYFRAQAKKSDLADAFLMAAQAALR
jgi:hypothetical protein